MCDAVRGAGPPTIGSGVGRYSPACERGGVPAGGGGGEPGQASHVIESQGLVQFGRIVPRQVPPIITIQGCGGIPKTVETGVSAVREMLPAVGACRRTTQPASKIILGTNCGGSDGNSGITANPALGIASGLIVAAGGTRVLGGTTGTQGAGGMLAPRGRA